MEDTPTGIPARSDRTASAEKGVSDAGFTSILQPAASAAPAFRAVIAEEKFQGVIAAVTPTGSRDTTVYHRDRKARATIFQGVNRKRFREAKSQFYDLFLLRLKRCGCPRTPNIPSWARFDLGEAGALCSGLRY
jgi:hypothetical protein